MSKLKYWDKATQGSEDNAYLQYSKLLFIVFVTNNRQVTRKKSNSGVVITDQRKFVVVLKTTSYANGLFKRGAVPLYCSLVTSLNNYRTSYADYVPY